MQQESAPRILVVDDEPGIREGCRKILSAEGFEVDVAEDGLAGYEKFIQNNNYVAALIDLRMPRLNGLELIEKIRKKDEDITLFVITAHATIETAVEATKRGAYNYIPKPFTPQELLLALHNGLEKRSLALEAKRFSEEREKQLLELAYERSKSKSILNCMTDGVIVMNRQKQIVLRNSAAARIIPELAGYTIPAALDDVITNDDLKDLLLEILQTTADNVIRTKEITLDKSTYMVNATPLHSPDRENLGVVTVLRDITALKKLDIAKSMFVSLVAHEVKKPLTYIENSLTTLLENMKNKGYKEEEGTLQNALSHSHHLLTMVNELIKLTAIETGQLALKRSPLNISRTVERVVRSMEPRAQAKNIDLSLIIGEGVAEEQVLADEYAMIIVLENLIDNAIKYTPDQGKVEVTIENSGMNITVSVKDNGIGMTEDEKSKAFEDFYRVKNDFTIQVPGTGLGLGLVKRFVDLHQGRITVQSRPGQGSIFKVSLQKI